MEAVCVDGPGGRVGQQMLAPAAAEHLRNTRGTPAEHESV